ncbi:MAG TPA: hypothetical protein VKP30_15885, partial [Polyangiaceae bacterium]|nr:hypothetical protein [Polyangiaceae bacterium]
APVRTDPKSVKMLEAAIDSAASPQGVVDEIQDSLALTTPRALAFGGVQGSPLYGDWAINVNEEAAAALREHSADETIAPSTPPTTDEGWRNDNAALKGIEVFIIVGVEPLAPSAAPKYESSAYPNATWRWWEPLRP